MRQRAAVEVRDALPDFGFGRQGGAVVVRRAGDLLDQIAHGAGGVHPPGGDADPLERERAHRDPPAAVDLADNRRIGNEHVIEEGT